MKRDANCSSEGDRHRIQIFVHDCVWSNVTTQLKTEYSGCLRVVSMPSVGDANPTQKNLFLLGLFRSRTLLRKEASKVGNAKC